MKLGQDKQKEVLTFLMQNCVKYADSKGLTNKKYKLIQEYTHYLQNKIDGRTVVQRSIDK